jgi:hypothetical protein
MKIKFTSRFLALLVAIGALAPLTVFSQATYYNMATGDYSEGFKAHEVQAVLPQAVSGEKDAVDDAGNISPQGIDLSKMVPLLTAALKDTILKVNVLEQQVAALQNNQAAV